MSHQVALISVATAIVLLAAQTVCGGEPDVTGDVEPSRRATLKSGRFELQIAGYQWATSIPNELNEHEPTEILEQADLALKPKSGYRLISVVGHVTVLDDPTEEQDFFNFNDGKLRLESASGPGDCRFIGVFDDSVSIIGLKGKPIHGWSLKPRRYVMRSSKPAYVQLVAVVPNTLTIESVALTAEGASALILKGVPLLTDSQLQQVRGQTTQQFDCESANSPLN